MFRFTIREFIFLTVLVSIAIAWWLDRSALLSRHAMTVQHAERLRDSLKHAEQSHAELWRILRQDNVMITVWEPDWAIADKPIPQ